MPGPVIGGAAGSGHQDPGHQQLLAAVKRQIETKHGWEFRLHANTRTVVDNLGEAGPAHGGNIVSIHGYLGGHSPR